MDRGLWSRVGVAGGLIGVVGIGLFALLWTVFAGVDDFPRLVLSVCIPPAVMAAFIGGYILLTRPTPDEYADPEPVTSDTASDDAPPYDEATRPN